MPSINFKVIFLDMVIRLSAGNQKGPPACPLNLSIEDASNVEDKTDDRLCVRSVFMPCSQLLTSLGNEL